MNESLFYQIYSQDPQLHSESILEALKDQRVTSLADYKGELTTKLTDIWHLAQKKIKKLWTSQKQHYDMFANECSIDVQDQVYVYTLAKKAGTAYKFACSFVDP